MVYKWNLLKIRHTENVIQEGKNFHTYPHKPLKILTYI